MEPAMISLSRWMEQRQPYQQYLQTDWWLEIRKRALRKAGYRCQLCYARGSLHVHHRTYRRLGNERMSDLTVLCEKCHGHFHETLKVDLDRNLMGEIDDIEEPIEIRLESAKQELEFIQEMIHWYWDRVDSQMRDELKERESLALQRVSLLGVGILA